MTYIMLKKSYTVICQGKISNSRQCYQNISQVLLTSAFILWPTCTHGFGIREKIRCGLRFFGVFLCRFAVFGPPLRPPP